MPALFNLVIVILAVALGAFLTLDLSGARTGAGVKVRWWGVGVAAVFLVAALGAVASVGQVEASERGIVLRFGAATNRVLSPGLYFVTPFVERVERMDIQTHAYEAAASAASSDLQDVSTTVTVNYKVNPGEVTKVYVTLQHDYVDRILKPFVQEAVKSVTAEYNAGDLITQRPKVKEEIEESLKARVGSYGVIVESVSITNFSFSKVFTDAIEAKVGAAQDAERARNKLVQIEVEAQQAKAQAEGEKNATIARAQGQADAILTVATAQAQANELVAGTLTNEIIQYAYVQRLADGTKVIVIPNGQQFILPASVLE